jgi:hypothetical protein
MFIYALNLLSNISLVPIRTYTIDELYKIISIIFYLFSSPTYLFVDEKFFVKCRKHSKAKMNWEVCSI